jgi:hypothetical protein
LWGIQVVSRANLKVSAVLVVNGTLLACKTTEFYIAFVPIASAAVRPCPDG